MDKKQDDFRDEELDKEMENFVPYVSPTGGVAEVIKGLESCPVCGCNLHFTNFTDFARMVSHEVVRCDECGYRAKKDMSNLQ